MPETTNVSSFKLRFQKTHDILLGCFDLFLKDPTIVNSDGLKAAMVHYERIYFEAYSKKIKVVIDDK